MDSIAKAVQRARGLSQPTSAPIISLPSDSATGVAGSPFDQRKASPAPSTVRQDAARSERTTLLDASILRRNRIVAFEPDAFAGRHYDLLRDQITHEQMGSDVIMVAVTGAARGSGATVTAANLAFTFARNTRHRVALISHEGSRDSSLVRYLGLDGLDWCNANWPGNEATGGHVSIGNASLWVDAPNRADQDSAYMLVDAARTNRRWPATVIVLDLPPLPVSDNAASYLSVSTNIVVVLANGETTLSQVESCKSVIGQRSGIHYILNKAGRHGL